VSARFPWDDRSVLVAAGGDRLGGRLVPAGCVTLSGEGREAAWALSAEAGGRQPTAVERFAIPFDVPGPGGADAALAGNEGLGPSRAVVVAAGYERRDLLSGVGGAVELASIARAITIARDGSTTARPVNADDELTVAASLWAAIGDTAGAGARSTIDLLWAEDDGALVSLEPIPTGSVGATAWLHSQLFRDGFLSVRWQLSVRHEAGLARGPWERLVGDAWTSVDVAAVGEAGPVRVFVEVRDVLDAGDERVPGQPPAGRRFSMGFSSSFWN
jgi:hypothetical protein